PSGCWGAASLSRPPTGLVDGPAERSDSGVAVAEHGTRTRVLLIGGDARTLRSLRLFLDALGVFEAVAVATGGAGLNALTRQPWAAVILVDDLHDLRPEEVMASAQQAGVRAAILALTVTGERSRP